MSSKSTTLILFFYPQKVFLIWMVSKLKKKEKEYRIKGRRSEEGFLKEFEDEESKHQLVII